MKVVVESKRLVFCEFLVSDAENFFNLNSDPEVLKYTGDSAFSNTKEAEKFLANYSDYQRNGMGRWTVLRKTDRAYLGWCGLKKHEEGMVDLGFRFFRKYWNQGYATEAAEACLKYGFEELDLKEIIGRVDRRNLASIRVLEKIGMTYWKEGECDGIKDALYFVIKAPG